MIIVEKTQYNSLFCSWYASLHFQVWIAWEWVVKQWETFPYFKLSDLSSYTKLPERKNSGQGFWRSFNCHMYDSVPWSDSHRNLLMYYNIFYSIPWWHNVIWGQKQNIILIIYTSLWLCDYYCVVQKLSNQIDSLTDWRKNLICYSTFHYPSRQNFK